MKTLYRNIIKVQMPTSLYSLKKYFNKDIITKIAHIFQNLYCLYINIHSLMDYIKFKSDDITKAN